MGNIVIGEGEPFENLANAIIILATKDYRKYLQKQFKNSQNEGARRELEKIECFFFSPWFEMLTDVPPEYLLRRLKKDERNNWEEKQKKLKKKAEEEAHGRKKKEKINE